MDYLSAKRSWLLPLMAAVAGVIAVHGVARAATLTELDSTNLALALQDFDVRLIDPTLLGLRSSSQWLTR